MNSKITWEIQESMKCHHDWISSIHHLSLSAAPMLRPSIFSALALVLIIHRGPWSKSALLVGTMAVTVFFLPPPRWLQSVSELAKRPSSSPMPIESKRLLSNWYSTVDQLSHYATEPSEQQDSAVMTLRLVTDLQTPELPLEGSIRITLPDQHCIPL